MDAAKASASTDAAARSDTPGCVARVDDLGLGGDNDDPPSEDLTWLDKLLNGTGDEEIEVGGDKSTLSAISEVVCNAGGVSEVQAIYNVLQQLARSILRTPTIIASHMDVLAYVFQLSIFDDVGDQEEAKVQEQFYQGLILLNEFILKGSEEDGPLMERWRDAMFACVAPDEKRALMENIAELLYQFLGSQQALRCFQDNLMEPIKVACAMDLQRSFAQSQRSTLSMFLRTAASNEMRQHDAVVGETATTFPGVSLHDLLSIPLYDKEEFLHWSNCTFGFPPVDPEDLLAQELHFYAARDAQKFATVSLRSLAEATADDSEDRMQAWAATWNQDHANAPFRFFRHKTLSGQSTWWCFHGETADGGPAAVLPAILSLHNCDKRALNALFFFLGFRAWVDLRPRNSRCFDPKEPSNNDLPSYYNVFESNCLGSYLGSELLERKSKGVRTP